MILTEKGHLKVTGSKSEVLADLSVIVENLLKTKTITLDDIKLAVSLSSEQFEKDLLAKETEKLKKEAELEKAKSEKLENKRNTKEELLNLINELFDEVD